MKEIDMNKYGRNAHYNWFRNFYNPCFELTVRLDITNALEFARKEKISSYAFILFIVTKCTNNIEKLRLRVLGDKVVDVECADASFTVAVGNEYRLARTDGKLPFKEFLTETKKVIEKAKITEQTGYNSQNKIDDIYYSCLPWIDYESCSQPVPETNPENRSIPRILWGKYTPEGDRVKMAFTVCADHSLVDGHDVSCLINNVQDIFSNPEKVYEL